MFRLCPPKFFSHLLLKVSKVEYDWTVAFAAEGSKHPAACRAIPGRGCEVPTMPLLCLHCEVSEICLQGSSPAKRNGLIRFDVGRPSKA